MIVERHEICQAVEILKNASQTIEGKKILEDLNVKFLLMAENGEVWRDVEGYDGDYQISNFGKVRSHKSGEWRNLKIYSDDHGYQFVRLSKNDKGRKFLVHVLVAKAFISNPENKPEVNHKFGDKSDNRACMLEWATRSENIKHAVRMGLRRPKRGVKNGNARLTEENVRYIRKNFQLKDDKFGAAALARKFNVDRKTIFKVIRNETYKDVI